MTRHLNRRTFLHHAAATGAAAALAPRALAAKTSPNEKLNIGLVGVSGRARANTRGVKSENIYALCDIDDRNIAAAKKKYPQAKVYSDWRKMMEDKGIDAVIISSTDHTHAPAGVMAMRLGKHVYCEKPLAHSVHEARAMGQACRETKVATQMGTQMHATGNYRRVIELVRSGAIGPVREAHVWCGRTCSPMDRPEQTPPVPEHLHWDLWLGPAPQRAYHPKYLPGNLTWNRWKDFANGVLGDMGSHLIDLPFWALELRHPTSVEAHGPKTRADLNPAWMIAEWQHPAKGDRPAVKLVWYQSKKRPESPDGVNLRKWKNGILFVGDKGKLLADYGRRVLLPADKFKGFQAPPKTIPDSVGHYKEWINACKTGSKTLCNFDYSGALIENNLLGMVAFRAGEKLQWDAKALKATNCAKAGEFIQREYRKGWTI
jgi:predicted dehydrogenase